MYAATVGASMAPWILADLVSGWYEGAKARVSAVITLLSGVVFAEAEDAGEGEGAPDEATGENVEESGGGEEQPPEGGEGEPEPEREPEQEQEQEQEEAEQQGQAPDEPERFWFEFQNGHKALVTEEQASRFGSQVTRVSDDGSGQEASTQQPTDQQVADYEAYIDKAIDEERELLEKEYRQRGGLEDDEDIDPEDADRIAQVANTNAILRLNRESARYQQQREAQAVRNAQQEEILKSATATVLASPLKDVVNFSTPYGKRVLNSTIVSAYSKWSSGAAPSLLEALGPEIEETHSDLQGFLTEKKIKNPNPKTKPVTSKGRQQPSPELARPVPVDIKDRAFVDTLASRFAQAMRGSD